jgi:parallel beta-helix repeat protein
MGWRGVLAHLVLVLPLAVLGVAGRVAAEDMGPEAYWVSTAGSDAAAGSLAQPWRTLQHAANAADSGATVYVRGGTYDGFELRRPGLAFEGYLGEEAVVSGTARHVIYVRNVRGATLRHLTVRGAPVARGAGISVSESSDVLIEGNRVLENRSYGIKTWNVADVTIRGNEVAGNDEGIYVSAGAERVRILDNDVHHQRTMIDPSSVDTGGGVGIAFVHASGGVLAAGNRLWANRAPSPQRGYDGAAFELFGSQDVTMVDNHIWDNKHVLETGTDGAPCRFTFARNVAYRGLGVPGYTRGVLIACGADSLVANNTLDGFDVAAVSVVSPEGNPFGGSLDGLRVANNILRSDGQPLYYLSHLPSTVEVDGNLLWNSSAGLAYVEGSGSAADLATLQAWTGLEAHGLNADPRFVDAEDGDYRPESDSPAIDRGGRVDGVTDAFVGLAPDVGCYEASPASPARDTAQAVPPTGGQNPTS